MATAFKVGAGKASITDNRAGLVMAGYAYEQQKSSGQVDLALMARAFVIEENRANPRRLCLVVIDAWACPEPIKTEVLSKLRTLYGTRYKRDNVVISATHTHSGPGGYAHYFLYNITTGGCDQTVIDKMVAGIVTAISAAHASLKPGHVCWAAGDVVGCGDNRSIASYRRNPEAALADGFAKRTDREMTVLKFVQNIGNTHKFIGVYSTYAIHPTNLGQNNVNVSGDNKGWAAKLYEDEMPAGFVAAFANGSAGDVSPNATVTQVSAANWSTAIDLPMGGPGNAVELVNDTGNMRSMGQLQFDKAKELADTAVEELVDRLDARCTHVDFSTVRINGQAGARTWPAAIGPSFGAGSREDGIAKVSFKIIWTIDIEPNISEGTNTAAFAAGEAATRAIIGNTRTNALANANSVFELALAALPVVAGLKLDDIQADALSRSWVFPTTARTIFPDRVESDRPQPTGAFTWKYNVPHKPNWPATYVTGHADKPIMFPVGLTELKKRRLGVTTIVPAPLVPQVIPLQVVKIGTLVLACVPAEFTTVAGLRLKAKLKTVFAARADHVALAGYSNDYAFYVTTPEEYAAQAYEGAGTLYGPHTLAAYAQEMGKLAVALRDGVAVATGVPVAPPAIFFKT